MSMQLLYVCGGVYAWGVLVGVWGVYAWDVLVGVGVCVGAIFSSRDMVYACFDKALSKMCVNPTVPTQQNSYSISHLLSQSLHCDWTVTV